MGWYCRVGDRGNRLWGGAGRDILIAGRTASILDGGTGQDLLIAGTTSYDPNANALQSWLTLWTSALSYDLRMSRLAAGTSVPRLDASTVTSNQHVNTLTGRADRDAFFAVTGRDALADRVTSETVTAIV